MISDMIYIICSDKILKKKLIFRNQKFVATANIFENSRFDESEWD